MAKKIGDAPAPGDQPASFVSRLKPPMRELLLILKSEIDGRPDAEGLTIAVGQMVMRLEQIVDRLSAG